MLAYITEVNDTTIMMGIAHCLRYNCMRFISGSGSYSMSEMIYDSLLHELQINCI
jgi:hypothetical protein